MTLFMYMYVYVQCSVFLLPGGLCPPPGGGMAGGGEVNMGGWLLPPGAFGYVCIYIVYVSLMRQ